MCESRFANSVDVALRLCNNILGFGLGQVCRASLGELLSGHLFELDRLLFFLKEEFKKNVYCLQNKVAYCRCRNV